VVELVRLAGSLLALVVATGLVAAIASAGADFGAVQLATEPAAVQRIVRRTEKRRALRRGLWADYAFIGAYWLAFVAIAVLLAHRGGWGRWVGAVAVLAATATALLDVTENIRTFGVLARHRPHDVLPTMQLRELRRASLTKWAASALSFALAAPLFVQHGRIVWVAVALLVLALVGLAGLLWRPLLRLFMLADALLAGTIAVLFLFWPHAVLWGL
jgi:hypothetical protein